MVERGRQTLSSGWKSQRKIVTDSLATHTTERADEREFGEEGGEREGGQRQDTCDHKGVQKPRTVDLYFGSGFLFKLFYTLDTTIIRVIPIDSP